MEIVYRTESLSVWRLSYLSALIYFTRNINELSQTRFTQLPVPHCEHKHAEIWWSHSYSSIRQDTWPRCERRRRPWLSMNLIRYRLEETRKSDKTSGCWQWDSKQVALNTVRLGVLGCDILNGRRFSPRFGKIQLPPTWDWPIWYDKGGRRILVKFITFVSEFTPSYPRRKNLRASSECKLQAMSKINV